MSSQGALQDDKRGSHRTYRGLTERSRDLKDTSNRIFQGLAQSYERTLDAATLLQDRRWKDWVIRRLNLSGGDPILDVGCGTLVLEERLNHTGCQVVGVDLSPRMITLGKAKGLANVSLLANGDAEFLPFPDMSFRTVVCCYVPKYVNLERFAGELARVTRHGGEVLVYDFVKPRGPFAPILEVYIRGGMVLVGLMLGMIRRDEATTFKELPRVVMETRWDAHISSEMEEKGFDCVETSRMAGVVFAYRGRRK